MKPKLYLLASDFKASLVCQARRDGVSPPPPDRVVSSRFSSGVEQLIRNERVISSNLISGSPLFQEDYLLKLTHLGLLAKVTEGSVLTPKVAFRRPKNGYRSRCGFSLAGESHGKVQCIGSAL